jgi:RNA-directed DNA polymerase
METWSAHHLFQEVSNQLGNDTAALIQRYAIHLRNRRLPVIFSLGHLGKITGISYDFLHESVNRKLEAVNYNMFSIRKRSGGRRFIHAVNGKLYSLQKYINEEVLQKEEPHPSSYAFHASGGIRECAAIHCGCKWLLQFDLTDFFYTISEAAVFNAFVALGYKRLLAFELTRLCTTLRLPESKRHYLNHKGLSRFSLTYFDEEKKLPYSHQKWIGVLPQGAPTSPMLSNLVAQRLDAALSDYAQENGFIYTRYADDLAFSASILPTGKSIAKLRREIISLIRKNGFLENCKKIRIAGPGAKKVVLGLLVDGERPRLTQEFRKRIDRNIYSIEKYGIEAVANNDGFESVYGFFNHLSGLMSFVHDVDLCLWKSYNSRFQKIKDSLEEQ